MLAAQEVFSPLGSKLVRKMEPEVIDGTISRLPVELK